MNAAGWAAVLASVGLVMVIADANAGERRLADARLCGDAIRAEERRRAYPRDLLLAIALVESGRYEETRGVRMPWPWTVTAGGRGEFFVSRAGAAAAVRDLRAKGIESIDVGCMQVNLYYHAEAFDSVEDALDPAQNVAYAAFFLTDLAVRTGSWLAAVGRYHSGSAENARRYRMRVLAARDAHRRHARDGLRPPNTFEQDPESRDVRDDEPQAVEGLPNMLRGSRNPHAPARTFAPGQTFLPIILRGGRGSDTDSDADEHP